MTILCRIRKDKQNNWWDLDSVLISVDGILGMPFARGFKDQFHAVSWLSHHVTRCLGIDCSHLFNGYSVPYDDLDVEVSYTFGVAYPTVSFHAFNISLSTFEVICDESQTKEDLDLLQLMKDICQG